MGEAKRRKQLDPNYGKANSQNHAMRELMYLTTDEKGLRWLDIMHKSLSRYPGTLIRQELEAKGYTQDVEKFNKLCHATEEELLAYTMQAVHLFCHLDPNFSFKNYSLFKSEDMGHVIKSYMYAILRIFDVERKTTLAV
ncbi:DUF2839 domain-containing protein [Nostoc sp. UHCC 0870]|uniref:DUF2839 domain-containing protein n=1 Tax=Nostoc sp. UHCC 0870 TaxID=2914041 RepID=UPI001EDF4F15|nr:DUF2839 domain-containing protein [Nostoc sp. UHCC 0870]UKP01583.1 DUF2839 domain-containing protein [Nostoc sp. UHCC 0870]